MTSPKSFKIVEDNEFGEEESLIMRGGAACAVDPELYAILKDLRKKTAKLHNLPPYVIFQDPSLEAMATTYPVTIEELALIQGVGVGKANRYGQDFVNVIKRHVIENEIERPEDIKVRNMANKNELKNSIIQAIDRKIALDELALSKGMEFAEMLTQLEAIIFSGRKIDIGYFIEEIMDPDLCDDIYAYFRESETDDLNKAIRELGDDCTEEEIRLVRIKFLSDMGC